MPKPDRANSPASARAEDLLAAGLMTVVEAAELAHVSRAFVYKLMDGGQLQFVKLGRSRRVPRQALLDLLARNLVG
jgi:excisionase family DNA binding protein